MAQKRAGDTEDQVENADSPLSRQLAAISRPSASPGEEQAARWVASRLREIGLKAKVQSYRAGAGCYVSARCVPLLPRPDRSSYRGGSRSRHVTRAPPPSGKRGLALGIRSPLDPRQRSSGRFARVGPSSPEKRRFGPRRHLPFQGTLLWRDPVAEARVKGALIRSV